MTDKPQTWRCHIEPCPHGGKWRTAPEGVTAEQAWEAHLRDVHHGKVGA